MTNYVAIAVEAHATGDTPEAAKEALQAAGGSLSQHIVYGLPEGAKDVTVNEETGAIQWIWADDAPDRDAGLTLVASEGVEEG